MFNCYVMLLDERGLVGYVKNCYRKMEGEDGINYTVM